MAPVNHSLPQRFYAFNDLNGSFDRVEIIRTPLTSVDDQIKALASDSATLLPRLYLLDGQSVHVNFTPRMLTMLTRLPAIRLSTQWIMKAATTSPRQPARMVPVFQPVEGSMQLAPMWTPPANMAVFFASHFELVAGTGWVYVRSSLITISTDKSVKGTFKMPLPNIYPNCKLCLGSGGETVQPDYRLPLGDVFAKSISVFQSSNWNGDLLRDNDPNVIERMFAFSAEDNRTQIPVPSDWHTLFVKVNNNDFSNIPLHALL